MARARFEFDSGDMERRVTRFGPKVNQAVRAVVDYNAQAATAYMKENASWTDRTGAARNGLNATASHQGSRHEIVLAHGVPYGIWLEIANSGRYGIILEATRVAGEKTMSMLRGILGD